MLTAVFLAYAVATFAALVWGVREYRARPTAALLMLLIPLVFLWYDSLVIASGRWLGAGETLRWLSWWRFTWHYLTLPLWLIAAGSIARLAGIEWARTRGGMAAFCVLATALILMELPLIANTQFYPACFADTLRMVQVVAAGSECSPGQPGVGPTSPPIPPIVTILGLLVVGALVWRRQRWPWMFVGSVVMLLLAALPASRFGPAWSSGGEVVLTWALLATVRRLAGGAPARAAQPALA